MIRLITYIVRRKIFLWARACGVVPCGACISVMCYISKSN